MEDSKLKISFFKFKEARDRVVDMLNGTYNFLNQVPQRIQSQIKSTENKKDHSLSGPALLTESDQLSAWNINLEKQMKTWRENPSWTDQPPKIEVTVPKGSLCNLNVAFKVGLPPDAIFNIVTDPGNKRVFKNIKEVIYRKVLVDEGLRQVVEVEQAAIWRFLWWTGTLSVHVYVDQNRENYTVKFKQGKSGFMKRFEGVWSLQPIFVDHELCSTTRPQNLMDYEECSEGKGRVGTLVKLEQLVQPSIVPPPPISWYVRGITAKTVETMIDDLIVESSRVRESGNESFVQEAEANNGEPAGAILHDIDDVEERWRHRRRPRTKRVS